MGRPILALPEQTVNDLRRLWATDDRERIGVYLLLLANAGWGYQPAARALDIHRETARAMAARSQEALSDPERLSGLPEVPVRPEPPEKPAPPLLSDEEQANLLRLQRAARGLRAEHPVDDPRRKAAEDLTWFIDKLTRKGITYAQLGGVLGVRPMSVRERLKRHGYRATNPALRPYAGYRPDRPVEELTTSS